MFSEMTVVNALWHLLLAALLGGVIGLERRWHGHIAGPHTSALVAVGSAIYVLLSAELAQPADVVRALGQVAVGIGFLCGGVIIRDGLDIRGLNTGATLWCVGGVGSLVGADYLLVSVGAAALLVIINLGLHLLEHRCAALRPSESDDE